jgi:GTP pyrophosphokinase
MKETAFIENIEKYLSETDVQKVKRAMEMAREVYGDSKTIWGTHYLENYLISADLLLELRPDAETLCACFLQKAPMLDEKILHEIEIEFGEHVKKLVDNLSQIIKFGERNESALLMPSKEYSQEITVDTLRRMFLAMATDLRVIAVRLAEKLNRLQNIHLLDKEVRKAYSQEVHDIFVPIADRLGIFQLKKKLEDLCFKNLNKKHFSEITGQFEQKSKKYKKNLEVMIKSIEEFLEENKIDAKVEGRVKGYYSTFKKMKRRNYANIDEILDLFALRVIVEKHDDCYRVLGLIHNRWQLLPGRFKDYIAAPKVNGYRSLHTTVTGLAKGIYTKPVEIQIRTEEMHAEAQYGIAAHWWYKQSDTDKRTFAGEHTLEQKQYAKNYDDKIQWVKNLVDLHENLKNNQEEFSQSVKLNLFSDRIFVLTPQGDVIDLPKGGTIVDFAYAVHSRIGDHCVRGLVNSEVVPLDYELKNGDTVEVQTDPKKTPNRYWLSFVKTTKAREKIHAWIRSIKREDIVREGKKMLNKHLKTLGEPELDSENLLLREYEGKRLTVKEREVVLEDIARGRISPLTVLKKLFPKHEFFRKRPESLKWKGKRGDAKKRSEIKILVTGEKGYETRKASCCKPKAGESIVGYVTRGGIVTVHKVGCKLLKSLEKSRFISVSWEGQQLEGVRMLLRIFMKDRKNILFDITRVIKSQEMEILDFNKVEDEGKDVLEMKVEVVDYQELDLLINKLEGIESVEKIETRNALIPS